MILNMFCMKRDKVLHSKQIYHHHAMMILVVDRTLSLTFDLDTYVNSSVQVSDNLNMLKKSTEIERYSVHQQRKCHCLQIVLLT